MVVKKFAKLSSCAVLCFLLGIMPASGADITSWENLRDEAENASEGSILNITEDITADGSSIGLLQKVLTLNFNGHTVNGGSYGDEPPLLFAANGSSETKVAVKNAVFKNFTVGEEGVIYSSNPHLEVIDVSLLNNKGSGEGVAIKNSAYNKLLITAQNSNVEISNNNSTGQEGGTGYGVFSSSSITLNAYEGKNLTINDDIKIDNSFDSDIYINNTFKSGCDLNGKVTLGGKLDLASSSAFISIGATGYKNGTLALTPNAARLNTLRLSVGGEATLDLQNYNIDSIVMGALKGETNAPLHLKLEYNAATGKMDCLDFSSVSIAGTPYLIVDEINILEDGDMANTAYLKNASGYLFEIAQDVISTKHGDKTYIFTPDAATKGSYIVSKARNVSDLPFYIQDTMSNDKSIAITSDMTLTEDLGTFAGADRDTTIFGNGYTINANGHGGVTVGDTTGQKFGFNKVTLKEIVKDFAPQPVITKDNVTMQIDTVVYFQITDPKLYTYGIESPISAIENLTATTLRNIIGELELDQTLTSRDIINSKMRSILDEATDPWGIKVNRVEVKNILPPRDIQEAMEKQMRAERERREKILQAEGEKKSSILIAEGEKESAILKAEAQKEAQIKMAEGEAEALLKIKKAEADGIKLLREAKADTSVLTLKSYEALEKLAEGQSTKIIVPSDMQNIATFGTVINEMIDKKK